MSASNMDQAFTLSCSRRDGEKAVLLKASNIAPGSGELDDAVIIQQQQEDNLAATGIVAKMEGALLFQCTLEQF